MSTTAWPAPISLSGSLAVLAGLHDETLGVADRTVRASSRGEGHAARLSGQISRRLDPFGSVVDAALVGPGEEACQSAAV